MRPGSAANARSSRSKLPYCSISSRRNRIRYSRSMANTSARARSVSSGEDRSGGKRPCRMLRVERRAVPVDEGCHILLQLRVQCRRRVDCSNQRADHAAPARVTRPDPAPVASAPAHPRTTRTPDPPHPRRPPVTACGWRPRRPVSAACAAVAPLSVSRTARKRSSASVTAAPSISRMRFMHRLLIGRAGHVDIQPAPAQDIERPVLHRRHLAVDHRHQGCALVAGLVDVPAPGCCPGTRSRACRSTTRRSCTWAQRPVIIPQPNQVGRTAGRVVFHARSSRRRCAAGRY